MGKNSPVLIHYVYNKVQWLLTNQTPIKRKTEYIMHILQSECQYCQKKNYVGFFFGSIVNVRVLIIYPLCSGFNIVYILIIHMNKITK